ncbi:MAG: methyltransferase domain-containing protein [Candidatus Riflebacteria bacterium]|nr:methyltransferase domain-containing protein [Candidatus Riflebacteria bacterium]
MGREPDSNNSSTNSANSSLSHELFEKISRFIYNQSGITLKDGKEALVASRLAKRLRALNIPSYASYFQYLEKDTSGEEIVQLLDAISTNVTHFFREPKHFDILHEKITTWKNAGQRRFRIWCAASSTGEEPYTLAMVMAEVCGLSGIDWKILATDISTRVLDIAKTGKYEEEKLKDVSSALKQKYFDQIKLEEQKYYRAKPALRERIVFKRLNLAEPPFPMHGPLDFVFCRNVMIYFDNNIRKPLIDEISRLLKPEGILIVGSSESLTGIITAMKSIGPSVYANIRK